MLKMKLWNQIDDLKPQLIQVKDKILEAVEMLDEAECLKNQL